MGDSDSTDRSPRFNGSFRVEVRPEKLTCHAGLVMFRELDERLALTTDLASRLVDERAPDRIEHSLTQLFRTSTYAMAIDSAHASAAAGMGDDAVFRIATCGKKGLSMLGDDDAVASQATLSRLFAQLSSEANLPHLRTALFDSTVRSVHAAGGETGHWLDLELCPGNVHTVKGAEEMLRPLTDRARVELSDNVRVRGDAGFI